MSLAPLDIGQVVAHLRSSVPALREVFGAAEFAAAVEANTAQTPAAFVVLESETFESGDYSEHGRIRIDSTVTVIVAVRNYAADMGATHGEAAAPVITAVRAALTGFTPTPVAGVRMQAMQPSGRAQLIRYDQAVLWWAEKFTFTRDASA